MDSYRTLFPASRTLFPRRFFRPSHDQSSLLGQSMAPHAMSIRSRSMDATATGLTSLPAELRLHAFSFLSLADHLVQLSMACKLFRGEVLDHRDLWRVIEFSRAAARRMTDSMLAMLLERVRAQECTTHLTLQYSSISGTGLLPLRSGVLHMLDLRQTHGPCASYHGDKYWDGAALLSVLEDMAERTACTAAGAHAFLPLRMSSDSYNHPMVDLVVNDQATAGRIWELQYRMTQVPMVCAKEPSTHDTDGSAGSQDNDDQKDRPALECSICHAANCLPESHESEMCSQCDVTLRCRSCDFTVCSFCEDDLPRKARCNNVYCPQWLCDVCEPDILMECHSCGAKFCDHVACGIGACDEAPEGEPLCNGCLERYEASDQDE